MLGEEKWVLFDRHKKKDPASFSFTFIVVPSLHSHPECYSPLEFGTESYARNEVLLGFVIQEKPEILEMNSQFTFI